MACRITGEPNQSFVTVYSSRGEKLRFIAEVKGAKGAVAIATADENILVPPQNPADVLPRYEILWKPPVPSGGGTTRKVVTTSFSFPIAVRYKYKVEVVGDNARVVNDVVVERADLPQCSAALIVTCK